MKLSFIENLTDQNCIPDNDQNAARIQQFNSFVDSCSHSSNIIACSGTAKLKKDTIYIILLRWVSINPYALINLYICPVHTSLHCLFHYNNISIILYNIFLQALQSICFWNSSSSGQTFFKYFLGNHALYYIYWDECKTLWRRAYV